MYYAVGGVVGLLMLAWGYTAFFSVEAGCRNGILDENEKGVDCGGACALICKSDARAPVVRWARSFAAQEGAYTAAAYVQNNNVGAGARRVGYTFQLFDADNVLVVEKRGAADIPPLPLVPVIEPNIAVGTREVARTLFAFTEEPQWERVGEPLPELKVSDQKLEGGRLTATLNNGARRAAEARVVAVLFDDAGAALGASISRVMVPARGEEFVVFTWSPAPRGVARAELIVLPPL